MIGLSYANGLTNLGTLSYAYDSLGRRVAVGGSFAQTNLPNPVSTAAYNANNQLTTWGTANLFYDANGNMTSDGTHSYSWDARNRLTQIDNGSTASLGYDLSGRRSSKSILGTTTNFAYDGANIVQEIIGGTNTANSLTGGTDEVLQRTDSSGTRSVLTDGLGSTLALADGTGTIQTSYKFDPFGNTTLSGSSTTNSSSYTGRELDATGLYFYRARYYNPTLQRFISEDPIGFRGGINKYAYVANSPTQYKDPFGLDKTPTACHEGQTPVSVDPFGNNVFQVGGDFGPWNGGLGYVPKTGDIYATGAIGNPGVGVFAGAGPTSNLDQEGPTISVSGFAGVGGGTSINPKTGDYTDLFGFGTPGPPTVAGGYTKRIASVPPAAMSVCFTAIDPSTAVPIGDGLYTSDDFGFLRNP